jgi:hypothetical protein
MNEGFHESMSYIKEQQLDRMSVELAQYRRLAGYMFTVLAQYAQWDDETNGAVRVLDIVRRRYGDLTIIFPPGSLVELEEEEDKALYGLDCEEELTRLLVEEIERTRNE